MPAFPPASSAGPMDGSNASLSKKAKELTAAAYKLTDKADGNENGHANASRAHRDAAWANKQAGNGTTAAKHEAIAAVHDEKSTPERAAKNFADTLGAHADKLTKKANMATAAGSTPANHDLYGDQTVKDPRSAQELHKEAEKAHTRASKAYGIADQPDKVKYHAGMAVEHNMKAGAA